MTDTMKERIARAILKRRFYDCEPDMYGRDLERFFSEIDPQHMHDARDEVEAVLAAMRDPDEKMLNFGACHVDQNRDVFDEGDIALSVFQAMIDAAISEGKE